MEVFMDRKLTAASCSPGREIPVSFDTKALCLVPNVVCYLLVEMDLNLANMENPAFKLVFENDDDVEAQKLEVEHIDVRKYVEFDECAPMVPLLRGYEIDLESFLNEEGRPPRPDELLFSRLSDGNVVISYRVSPEEFWINFTVMVMHPRGHEYVFTTSASVPYKELAKFIDLK